MATLHTNHGAIELELFPDEAPKTVQNFEELAPEQDHEARLLAREIVAGLESGRLEPTAAAIEPFADRLPS